MTEPAFPIRLIALDIDGTLVDDALTVGDRTIRAVRAAMERDVAVSIVTGRMVSSGLRFADILGLRGPIVGYQGALIRSMPEPATGDARRRLGKLLLHTPLPGPVARDIVAWTREQGLDPHLNHLERFVVRADDPQADDYSAFMGHRAELVDDLLDWASRHPATKVMAVAEPPTPTLVAPLARARFAGVADVTISHPKYLEFVAPGVSKGRAIRWLARRLGIPLEATLAVGDQWNDLEMIAEVGHGAAMPTAPAGVQAVARYIAAPVTDEGPAQLIEQLVLATPSESMAAARRLAAEAIERRAASA